MEQSRMLKGVLLYTVPILISKSLYLHLHALIASGTAHSRVTGMTHSGHYAVSRLNEGGSTQEILLWNFPGTRVFHCKT